MRLAFWRASKDKVAEENPAAEPALPKVALSERASSKPVSSKPALPEPAIGKPSAAPISGNLDVRALGQALLRKKRWIIIPTLLAAAVSIAAVNLVTPRYKSEARILIDGR